MNSLQKQKIFFNKSYQVGRPVRLIGVRFSQLIPFTMQMSLFDNKVEKLQLYKAVDDIKERFGSKIVTKAVNSGAREEAFNFSQHNKKKQPEDKGKKL